MDYDFWNKWKNKNNIEKEAIASVKKARDLIINSVPKNKLFAIYIKGSFVRREMKKGSDVDIVPIVTENRYQNRIFEVNNHDVFPAIVVPLSISEFKHNRLFTPGEFKPDLRGRPDNFLRRLKNYKLIYGKPLNPKKYKIRNNKKVMSDEIKLIRDGYIKAYEKNKIKFGPLLKEVFWLTEQEQILLGKKIKHSFESIARSVKNKEHIIHDALKLRKGKSKNKKKFISKLKKHLEELDKKNFINKEGL